MTTHNKLAVAAFSGLFAAGMMVSGSAFAEHHTADKATSEATTEKNACKTEDGKEKHACKTEAGKEKHACKTEAGKEKHACKTEAAKPAVK